MTRRTPTPFLIPLMASLYFSGAHTSATAAAPARPRWVELQPLRRR